ncbi:MAG: hypothetical protein K2N38_09290 [Oscillospiraceae bacterium]|nr:hypothetical protein [Oscillospiraceae bacterium]
MKHIVQNIRTLVKNERFIFIVMMLSVFVSAWVMTFSYGLYHNYSEMLAQETDKSTYVDPMVADGMTLTRGDFVRYLNELSPKTLDATENIVVSASFPAVDNNGYDSKEHMTSRFAIRSGSFVPSPYIVQLWNDNNMIASGRYISDSEEANGEKVVMTEQGYVKQSCPSLYIDDETVLVNGEEYKIVGTHTSSDFIVPFLSMPEDTELPGYISIGFTNPITRKQYDELVNTAERVLPGVLVFPEQGFTDEQSIFIYNNMLVVSVLIAVLTIVNFAFLYSFILQRRARTLAIMRICGCTKGRAWGICMGECCLICIPTFLIGVLTYIPLLHGVLGDMFEFIEEAYSLVVYGLLFAIFAAVLLTVMGILLSRQIHMEIAEGRKGGAA